jgi:hypothetical protein
VVPAIPPPGNVDFPITLELKLKAEWSYDVGRRKFITDTGDEFSPWHDLPKGSKIFNKVPRKLLPENRPLTRAERDLLRYLQVILPVGRAPVELVEPLQRWRCLESVSLGPQVSLPQKQDGS